MNRSTNQKMCTVLDVASYILAKKGLMTTMKLQKLVYYAQAWSLIWDEKPLFKNRIEAWANGPVAPTLYGVHKGKFLVRRIPHGDARKLSQTQKETVDAVLGYYGNKSSQWLTDLTHSEAPWIKARNGLAPGKRGRVVITHAAMAEYYEAL